MKPGGSTSPATRCISAMACPELTPGTPDPVISVARNRLKWLITAGDVFSLRRTTDPSGTIVPLLART